MFSLTFTNRLSIWQAVFYWRHGLDELAVELKTADTVAVVLTGSYARGDAGPHSDIDILRFVDVLPAEADRYTLFYRKGRLVSHSVTSIDAKRGELSQPDTAILAVEGLRQARILYDSDGAFAALQAQAAAFVWDEAMQAKADAYASYTLCGYAEEVMKVLNGMQRQQESTLYAGLLGLEIGLARVLVVAHGVLLVSENDLFQVAVELGGPDMRDAFGWTGGSLRMRGAAALRVYRQLAHELNILPAHAAVIHEAARRVEQLV